MVKKKEITVLKEIEDYIIPLSKDEFSLLERSILSEGCREPLKVWKKGTELILVDGHNRYRICRKHELPFQTTALSFKNIDEVKVWMIDNQMGRRNLNADQLSYYRGLKYQTMKNAKGGYSNIQAKGNTQVATSEKVASQFNVSESTVKRDSKYAQGLDIIGRHNPKLKLRILSGLVKVKKSDVQTLSDAKRPEKLNIRNEADLYNKAKIIREEILDEVESGIKRIQTNKIEKARQSLKEAEPIFLKKDDRLRKIKGMILSATNKAIKEKDVQAIKELKKLVERLANELIDS